MLHPSAPKSKGLKYARVERERRFLLAAVPPGLPVWSRALTDRYVRGTRLRLRRSIEATERGDEEIYKLTQKIPAADGSPGLITNVYLDAAEFAVLGVLPAAVLAKTRHSLPPWGVDVFGGRLAGLILAEAEFASDEEMQVFDPPGDVVAEVTRDRRFTGGHLAVASRAEVAAAAAGYGVDLGSADRRDVDPGAGDPRPG